MITSGHGSPLLQSDRLGYGRRGATVEVTAATLFEAVALGLKQLQGNAWVAGIGRPMDTVTVSVKSIPVEHRVRIGEFTKWLERPGTSPAEITRRRKVREILGLPVSRT